MSEKLQLQTSHIVFIKKVINSCKHEEHLINTYAWIERLSKRFTIPPWFFNNVRNYMIERAISFNKVKKS